MFGGSSILSGRAGRLLVFLAIVGPAAGATLVTPATRDNSLYLDLAGALSNGAGPTIFAGNTAGGATRRALLAFDLSAIPAGSVVESVTLTLFLAQAQTFVTPVTVHAVSRPWGEGTSNAGPRGGGGTGATPGDATWLHAFSPGTLWATPGGDFTAAGSATTSVGVEGLFYTWDSTAALVADVQRWVDAPATNAGWMLRGDETQGGTAKAFASREASDPAHRPALTITYQPVPEPTALGLLTLALALLALRLRKREESTTLSPAPPACGLSPIRRRLP